MNRIKSIDGGSKAYWMDRKVAFALICAAEEAAKDMRSAQLYRCVGYDKDGDPIIEENIKPFDVFEDACSAVQSNQAARKILYAKGRNEICGRSIVEHKPK